MASEKIAPPKPETLSRAAQTIREVFASGRPLTYVRTAEEQRVADALAEVAAVLLAKPMPIWTWSITEDLRCNDQRNDRGLKRNDDGSQRNDGRSQRNDGGSQRNDGPHRKSHTVEADAQAETRAPRAVLDFIAAHREPAIFHLKDFHEPLRESSEIRRRLRDVYQSCLDQHKFVVITSPVRFIPEEIERSVIFLELRPPDSVELRAFLHQEALHQNVLHEEAVLHQIARALQGLTLDEARYALRRGVAADPKLGPLALRALLEEKRLLINRSGVIEYISDPTDLDAVGGLETLKKWLIERQKLFQMRDNLSTEIVPKGVLFMGIPGCGKSLCVKAIANAFQLPLYRVDMIEIFSGRHGKPEGAFVEACKMMEDIAPAVLWFDEIEMGITSTENSGEQGRIFAFFLTWMQEKTRGLFVAATANRIDLLPAEMIRKGRFDEVFFVDIPLEHEQLEIFKIHLLQRGIDAEAFNLKQLTKFTVGWTGAEIEQCVISALTRARLADRDLNEQDLINIAVKLVPLSRTMKEQISHIRAWAFERAIRASANPDR